MTCTKPFLHLQKVKTRNLTYPEEAKPHGAVEAGLSPAEAARLVTVFGKQDRSEKDQDITLDDQLFGCHSPDSSSVSISFRRRFACRFFRVYP